MLERNAGRLLDCRERLNFCPLGACALAGTGLPIDRFMTSDALGFTAPMRNSMDAVSDRDFVLELLSANSIIFVPLSRLGEELVLWTSEEFGFITPSDLVSTGSSMMPQKKNPDPMELVRGKSARGIGDLMRLLTLCKGLPLAYNHDLQEDKEPVFDSVKTIIGMLEVSAKFAQNIAINLDRIQKTLPAGHLDATTLADYLVHKRTQEAPGAKKIVMTAEYFQWVTQALVMRLRQHGETVAREGTELAGMRQRGQIQWFSVGDKKDTLKD